MAAEASGNWSMCNADLSGYANQASQQRMRSSILVSAPRRRLTQVIATRTYIAYLSRTATMDGPRGGCWAYDEVGSIAPVVERDEMATGDQWRRKELSFEVGQCSRKRVQQLKKT